MKRIFILFIFIVLPASLYCQPGQAAEVFLITCGPGTETYSIYGHSALRITDATTDIVYNWGVFDFSTPHFAWKFAKGRLNYLLDTERFNNFLQEYIYEKRWVLSQKINLDEDETDTLRYLISENLKPENMEYRYDFFYDDCSTRIRDILEKSIGKKLFYPPDDKKTRFSFRDKINEYQRPYPWLNMGIDLLIGTPGDKTAGFRDRMFLPLEMQKELSQALVNREGKMIPLLQNPVNVLDYSSPKVRQHFFASPLFVFTAAFIILMLFFALIRKRKINNIMDIIIFLIFSLLAILMIFFNFFTDHEQLRKNLNIIWLNPFLFLCLTSLILNKDWHIWFRIVFFLSLLAFVIQILFPHAFNNAFIPLLMILMLRSSSRAGFSWNPLSVESI